MNLLKLSEILSKYLYQSTILILIGSPLSGKTTFSNIALSLNNNIQAISIGNILKSTIYSDVIFGKFSDYIIKNNKFIDQELLIILLCLNLKNKKNNIIFDGFPRTLKQFQDWSHVLKKCLKIRIVEVQTNVKILKQRIKKRKICSRCFKTFLDLNICNFCNVKLVRRSDDNVELFNKRYDHYLKELDKIKIFCRNNMFVINTIFNNDDLTNFTCSIRKIIKKLT